MKNVSKMALISSILLLILAFLFFKKEGRESAEIVKKICICKAIEHEALNSVVDGISHYLKQSNNGCEVFVETSQGNAALASQIITKFLTSKADVIATIGTSPSQCAFKLAKDGKIKLVFSSVTNPSDISPDLVETNTTGVSNFVDLDPQIKLFKRIQPSLLKLGIVYNPTESNSTSIVKELKRVCERNSIQLFEQGLSRLSDIPQALSSLLYSVDAVFISNDNLALSGITSIVSICNQRKIPVYVSDTDQVKNGCIASLGPNQYDIGIQTGKIIEQIINGKDINLIPISYPDVCEIHINLKAARSLNIEIPEEVLKQAKMLYD
ncbi:MAG: ABC transporter substrate-binding protein [Holosporales bacterium]|jgi:putative ABC transport system substrate-binding protein|nr:ABC transporter substrate-binding protein [Holosporales bacterium]